jgi:DNA-binding response OmpR family regulator
MRLLFVEDDRSLSDVVVPELRRLAFAVDYTETCVGAFDLLCVNTYDLVLLDLGLPDADGLTLVHRLRRREVSVPILILTARGAVPDRVVGLNAGADDYLQKPFAFPELLARIHALLRRGCTAPATTFRVADLELDPVRFEVRRGDNLLALTTKEFGILEYLMQHSGELVTRTMLIEHCWDESYEGVSNLIDVHVSRVRRKIDAAGESPLLHTVRGAGFILREA